MAEAPTCRKCGTALDQATPLGLCPKCLMRVGLGSVASNGVESSAAPETDAVAGLPDPALLAQCFPQLEIVELLGQGGMGAVYKALQPSLNRFVALKILVPRSGTDSGFAERFAREAQALARLNHPNIVTVYDFGHAAGFSYFLMEFVDGRNLRQLQQAGVLSPREALRIVPQICEALQFAHENGVVHRDIKPENVLVDTKGRVKIADFGLAKILGSDPMAVRLTGARDLMGTPNYMAPEQVEHPAEVDHRADIYSLGVVFYELLTGELPLGRFEPPSHRVQVDVRLDHVVLHALEKQPERRYQHASDVKTDVQSIATTPAPVPPQTGQEAVIATPARRQFWRPLTTAVVLAMGLIILAAAGLAALSLMYFRLSTPTPVRGMQPANSVERSGPTIVLPDPPGRPIEFSVPPVVVSTLPQAGDTAVSPSRGEIIVTFSKPMREGCFSWVKASDDSFPEATGEPRFSPDRRVCSLPVKLAPGKFYAVWVNSETAANFQDDAGRSAVPYLLVFRTK